MHFLICLTLGIKRSCTWAMTWNKDCKIRCFSIYIEAFQSKNLTAIVSFPLPHRQTPQHYSLFPKRDLFKYFCTWKWSIRLMLDKTTFRHCLEAWMLWGTECYQVLSNSLMFNSENHWQLWRKFEWKYWGPNPYIPFHFPMVTSQKVGCSSLEA